MADQYFNSPIDPTTVTRLASNNPTFTVDEMGHLIIVYPDGKRTDIGKVNGNTIIPTSGDPDNSIGVNGDFALDVTTGTLYGPKENDLWDLPNGMPLIGSGGSTGAKGEKGTSVASMQINDAGHLIITMSDDSTHDVGYARGAAGEDGQNGSPGIQGPQGQKGDVGDTGPKGDTGLTGSQGLKGDPGLKGDTGSQGVAGPQGLKGDIGNTGPQGPIGLTGAKGDTGAIGPKGDTGLQGLIGLTGAAGSQGIKGDTGNTGAQGPIGNTGPTGATGAQGIQGPTGATGSAGTNGANGVSIRWQGSFATAPNNPTLNWAYYNTALKTSYVWDGTTWQILAKDGAASFILASGAANGPLAAIAIGGTITVVVTLNATMPDTNYQATATLVSGGTVSLLGQISITGITAKTTTQVTIQLKNSALLSLDISSLRVEVIAIKAVSP